MSSWSTGATRAREETEQGTVFADQEGAREPHRTAAPGPCGPQPSRAAPRSAAERTSRGKAVGLQEASARRTAGTSSGTVLQLWQLSPPAATERHFPKSPHSCH